MLALSHALGIQWWSKYIQSLSLWSLWFYVGEVHGVPDAGKDWGQKEKRVSEDEISGWHHRCNGHELGQTPRDGEGQGDLAYVRLQRVGHDWQLNNNKYVEFTFPNLGREAEAAGSCLRSNCWELKASGCRRTQTWPAAWERGSDWTCRVLVFAI